MSRTVSKSSRVFCNLSGFGGLLAVLALASCKTSSSPSAAEGGGNGTAGSSGGAKSSSDTTATGGVTATGGTAMGGVTATGGTASAGTSSSGQSSGGAASIGGGGGVSAGNGGAKAAGSLRILPLGDSITETTCQTQLTWKNLRDANHTNFDLVGTRPNQQSCGVTNPDRDCEGHGGYLVTDLVGSGQHASEPAAWFSAGRADVVLMHFGTNDVWNGIAPTPILSAYSTLVDGLRAVNPNVISFVAQIIPMNPSGCSECASRVVALNSQIPAWAAAKSTANSPIYVVDQWTGFDTATDTGDGVHPNLPGSQKMADKWSAALIQRGIF